MQAQQAQTILKALADGCHPRTGEAFPDDSAYQDPLAVRALHFALDNLKATEDKATAIVEKSTNKPSRSGKPWTPDEEAIVLAGFEAGEDLADIGRKIQRSSVAVTARLVKLGKMEAPANLRFAES